PFFLVRKSQRHTTQRLSLMRCCNALGRCVISAIYVRGLTDIATTEFHEDCKQVLGLLFAWFTPEYFSGHVVDEGSLPIVVQSPDVLLAELRDLDPARPAVDVIEFRRRRLLARLLRAALLHAAGENDLGIGVAVFSFFDLSVAVLDQSS